MDSRADESNYLFYWSHGRMRTTRQVNLRQGVRPAHDQASIEHDIEQSVCLRCHYLNACGHEDSVNDHLGFSRLAIAFKLADLDIDDCPYCRLLSQVIDHFVPDLRETTTDPSIHLSLIQGRPASVEVVGIQDADDTDSGEERTIALPFYLYTRSQDEADQQSLPVARGQHSSCSDADECFQFARDSYTICRESHTNCRNKATPVALPRRVFDVDGLQLIDSAEKRGHYACLSHCWGKVDIIKSKIDNLNNMAAGIPWERLSDVFQNAVTVCRRLGVKYLWIDSLCIIQDSRKDWEIESARICDYYENAEFTISAAASPNGETPFLAARAERWLPVHFDVKGNDGLIRTFYARERGGTSATMQRIEDVGPLSYRGWAWQESILSRRILHYAPSELVWECAENVLTEDGGSPRSYWLRMTRHLKIAQKQPVTGWHGLVSTYSARKLTYTTDRLPALSGVATRMNEVIRSDYLSGLWRSNLLDDLCWAIDYDSYPDDPIVLCAQEYIAPSWAWPSVNGPIVFEDAGPGDEVTPLATIKNARCTVPGLNPYGQVSSGYLIIHGKVAELQIEREDLMSTWTYFVSSDGERVALTIDCLVVEHEGIIKRASAEDNLQPFSCTVPCLLLRKVAAEDDSPFYFVLVLSEVEKDQYVRIGCASLDDDEYFRNATKRTIRIV